MASPVRPHLVRVHVNTSYESQAAQTTPVYLSLAGDGTPAVKGAGGGRSFGWNMWGTTTTTT